MAALNFPDPNVTQDYVHTDDQGTVVEYKWNSAKGLWQAVSVTGISFPEAPNDGEDYVRNSEDWVEANYFSGDYSDLSNSPDLTGYALQTALDAEAKSRYDDDVLLQAEIDEVEALIPTDNSELENGAGYITVSEVPDTGGFSVGTKMVFAQSAPDTGWTIDTTNNDAALRVVNDSTGGTTGGAVGFTSAFSSQSDSVSITCSFSGASGSGSTDDRTMAFGIVRSVEALGNVTTDSNSVSEGQTWNHGHSGSIFINTSGSYAGTAGGPWRYGAETWTTTRGSSQAHTHGVGGTHTHNVPLDNIPSNQRTHSHGVTVSGISGSGSGSDSVNFDLRVKYTNVCIGVKN